MLKIHQNGMYVKEGALIPASDAGVAHLPTPAQAKKGTIAYGILQSHSVSNDPEKLAIYFELLPHLNVYYIRWILSKLPVPPAWKSSPFPMC